MKQILQVMSIHLTLLKMYLVFISYSYKSLLLKYVHSKKTIYIVKYCQAKNDVLLQ